MIKFDPFDITSERITGTFDVPRGYRILLDTIKEIPEGKYITRVTVEYEPPVS